MEDYPHLVKTLRSSGSWWHQLESAWIIKADTSAASILEKLRPHLDPADELLVVELSGRGAWTGFDANGASWLKLTSPTGCQSLQVTVESKIN